MKTNLMNLINKFTISIGILGLLIGGVSFINGIISKEIYAYVYGIMFIFIGIILIGGLE